MQITFENICEKVFIRFRRRRMNRFFALFCPGLETRVLDIGGTPQTWETEAEGEVKLAVTLINIRSDQIADHERFRGVVGDATALPFGDKEFEIAFSNSVIEHVGEWGRQQAFASEARRVASRLWIQTPARSFPLEPHLLAPFIQYLPKYVQHRIARWTPRGLLTPDVVHQIVDEVRLLSYQEFKQLFPDCVVLRERFFGLTKSYIAVKM